MFKPGLTGNGQVEAIPLMGGFYN